MWKQIKQIKVNVWNVQYSVSAAAYLTLNFVWNVFTHAVFSVIPRFCTPPWSLRFEFPLTPVPLPSLARDGYRSDMSQLKGLQGLWSTGLPGRRGGSQIDLSLGGRGKCANKAPRSFKFSFGLWHSNLMCFCYLGEGS